MRKNGRTLTRGEQVRERLGLDRAPANAPWRETPQERAAILIRQITKNREAERQPPNPYQSRFYNFWTHCCWTIDEARAGLVRRPPTGIAADGLSYDELWMCLEERLLLRRLNFWEKSRRVMASWFVCAFDVWLAAGGWDPRWAILCDSQRNRQVVLAARKEKGYAGSQWFLDRRIGTIIREAEARNIGDTWGSSWPSWEITANDITNSMGGAITGVPQGSDQLRGGGATHLHFEELAFWEEAKPAIGGSIPTLSGLAHATVITTAQVASYAKEIRDGGAKHASRA